MDNAKGKLGLRKAGAAANREFPHGAVDAAGFGNTGSGDDDAASSR